jgi:Domain of unknown function (DUF1918)
MSRSTQQPVAAVGDVIIIGGHHVGDSRRAGEILEVLGSPGHEHYRVRWDDDRETVFYPGSDATIRKDRAVKDRPQAARSR